LALAAASLVAALVLSGCGLFIIDHDAAARDFCQANVENNVFKEARIDEEGRVFSEDQAVFWSDEYSKTMKYAEDSTRSLRSIARDLADAYDDVRGIADEDPEDIPQEELDEKYGELRTMRKEVREACQPYLEQIEAEAAAREEDQ
jgi:hypothetical protein